MQTLRTKRRDVSHDPDSDLVALVLAGDGTAFAAIMTRYNQRLFRVARGIVRDEAEAEDVLQEAYVRAFAALPGFRGEAGLGTWLTRIVLNEALGRMRRRRPTEQLDVLDQDAQTGDSRVVMFPGVNSAPSSRSRRGPLGGAAPARARHRRPARAVPACVRDAGRRGDEYRGNGRKPRHSS